MLSCLFNRDVDSKVTFPHVNFSIPWAVISPVLDHYLQTDGETNIHTDLTPSLDSNLYQPSPT